MARSEFQLDLPAGWDRGRDIAVDADFSYADDRRYSYDVQVTRGHYGIFRLEDAQAKSLTVAFSETLNAVNRTSDAALAPIRAAVEEEPPGGDRDRFTKERQNLKRLTELAMQWTEGSRERLCYEGARLAYYFATVGRVPWLCWSNEYQDHALNKFEQAQSDTSCPNIAKEALQISLDVLREDDRALDLKPDDDDLDDADFRNNQMIRTNADNVMKELNEYVLYGRSFEGVEPTTPIVGMIQTILENRVGWGAKVRILCAAMIVFHRRGSVLLRRRSALSNASMKNTC